jgi:hypothetical protein
MAVLADVINTTLSLTEGQRPWKTDSFTNKNYSLNLNYTVNTDIGGFGTTGSITVSSAVTGTILIDGKDKGIRISKAGGSAVIQNVSTGATEVSLKDDTGALWASLPAMVRQGQTVTAEIAYKIADTGGQVTITDYTGAAIDVTIPARINNMPVTAIGIEAFQGNQLTSVSIPNSVTSIGNFAFASNKLTSVSIPSSVTSIGELAFWRNRSTSISIGSNVVLAGGENPSFDNGFDAFYNTNGKQAGTYTWKPPLWNGEESWSYRR